MKKHFLSAIFFLFICIKGFSWSCGVDGRQLVEFLNTFQTKDSVIIVKAKILSLDTNEKSITSQIQILNCLFGNLKAKRLTILCGSTDFEKPKIHPNENWILFIYQGKVYSAGGVCDQYSIALDESEKSKCLSDIVERILDIRKHKKTLTTNFYFSPGKLAAKGSYKNGIEEGYWEFYQTSRDLWSLYRQGNFSNGKRSGEWVYYDWENKIKTKSMVLNDTLLSQIDYFQYPNKIRIIHIRMADGTTVNRWFTKEGKPEVFRVWNDKKQSNKQCRDEYVEYYHSNGNLKSHGTYQDCKKLDDWEYYTEDGKPTIKPW